MNFEETILKLIRKLRLFGYSRFQVKVIINEAIEQRTWTRSNDVQNKKIMHALERYGELGSAFMQAYSK